MGEAADLLQDGILDASGEYTGRNPGHPVYPKGWFQEQNVNYGNRVFNFLKVREIKGHDDKVAMVMEYAKYAQLQNMKFGRVCKYICTDGKSWKKFKVWVDGKIGYVKPSKAANSK